MAAPPFAIAASSNVAFEEETGALSSFRRLSLKPRKNSTTDITGQERKRPPSEQTRRSSLAAFSSKLRISRRSKVQEVQNESNRMGDRFLELPTEIQTHVLRYLAAKDILALRVTSKYLLAVIQSNATTVALQVLRNLDPDPKDTVPLSSLYPPPAACMNDTYLLQMLHRERVIRRQLRVVLTFVQTRVYMMRINASLQCQHFSAYRAGLADCLYKPAWLAQHFLESLRDLFTRQHLSHDIRSDRDSGFYCSSCINTAKTLFDSYPQDEIVMIYHFTQMLIFQLRTATRAPTFVAGFERKLRGWGNGPLPEHQIRQFVILGGLEEVSKINEMEGTYGKRLAFVTNFLTKISDAVRINAIAWPHTSPTDPVMVTPVEREADVTRSLDPPYMLMTQEMIDNVPEIDSFLLGKESLMAQRISAANLISVEEDYDKPFGWIQRLMISCYRPEDDSGFSTNESRGRRQSTIADEGEDSDDDLPGIEPEE